MKNINALDSCIGGLIFFGIPSYCLGTLFFMLNIIYPISTLSNCDLILLACLFYVIVPLLGFLMGLGRCKNE